MARVRVPGWKLGAQGGQDREVGRGAHAVCRRRIRRYQLNRTTTHHPGTLIPARFAGVVFDLDGVLLDTERLCGETEARLCAAHGVEYSAEDRAATLGLTAQGACRYFAARFGMPPETVPRLESEYNSLMLEGLETAARPLPGAAELVARLAAGSVKLAVATNSDRSMVDKALDASGMRRWFGAVVTADDVARPKPAPDPYRLACELLSVSPDRALALEDSMVGARSALAAGLVCYAVGGAPWAGDVPASLRQVGSLVDLVVA